jgi:hypothetical protein
MYIQQHRGLNFPERLDVTLWAAGILIPGVELTRLAAKTCLATCGIRRPELPCENPLCCLLLLADSSVEEYNCKH